MGFLNLPEWATYLIEGVLLFAGLSSAAVVLTRTGRSPYWVFLLLLPIVNVLVVWYLAFAAWSAPLKKS